MSDSEKDSLTYRQWSCGDFSKSFKNIKDTKSLEINQINEWNTPFPDNDITNYAVASSTDSSDFLYMHNNHPISVLWPENGVGFQRRGFYLHGSWVMEYPFSVRSWQRQDFDRMFHLLKHLGFTTVLLWLTPETAPMPLSDEDASILRGYRVVIDDAKKNGLECWFVYCPNVISTDEVRSLQWKERSLYASTKVIRLTNDTIARAYLDHRKSILHCIDNADAYVVIDGDPGGYPGAPIDEYLRILKSDQTAVPDKLVIPWLWSGWGRNSNVKGQGFWYSPVEPPIHNSLEAIKRQMTGKWELLPGRSHREDWANGRIPVEETQKAGLMSRSTIMCYEAIEFEPSEPAATIQFDLIRQVLRQEHQLSPEAKGVFGNSMCPVLVLPNLYFFARGSADLNYLNKSDNEVLADLSRELGDIQGLLIPAWSCLKLPLSELPADLPSRLDALKLSTDFARCIPGGPDRYMEIIAAQVKSRRQLLEAAAENPSNATEAAISLAKGANALLYWWQIHRYVGMGRKGDPFQWRFIREDQVEILRELARRCFAISPDVITTAARIISEKNFLTTGTAETLIKQLLYTKTTGLPGM
jgi:hypothetical protein